MLLDDDSYYTESSVVFFLLFLFFFIYCVYVCEVAWLLRLTETENFSSTNANAHQTPIHTAHKRKYGQSQITQYV